MIRIIKSGPKYYGYEIDSVEDDLENIEQYISEGTSVLLVEELDDYCLQEFGLEPDDIEMLY